MVFLRGRHCIESTLNATTHLCTCGIHNVPCGAIIRIAGLFNYFIRRGIRLRTIDNIVCLLTEYLYRVSDPVVTINNNGGE